MQTEIAQQRKKAARARARRETFASYLFLLPYLVLLLMFGIFPVCYAFGLSFIDAVDGGFYGLTNYAAAVSDFRLPQSILNILTYVVIWVAVTVVGVTAISMMLDTVSKNTAAVLRTVFFLPGAMTSSAIVVLWLFLLDPVVSPFQIVYHLFGWQNRANVMTGMTYAGVFATMGYFAGSGGWIVVFGGAIAGLPREVMEAARIDGANRWQLATRIKVPMLWRSIALMAILCVAGGLQIFVEPQLLTLLGSSYAQPDWSVNQLAFQYAFSLGDFGISAALSTGLLVASISIALIIVFATRFYRIS